jgi:hypothetical protein
MGKIVFNEDRFVNPGEILIFVYFLIEFCSLEELGLLGGLESLGLQGSDVLDLGQFLLEVANLIEDHLEDGVAVLLLLTNNHGQVLLHALTECQSNIILLV